MDTKKKNLIMQLRSITSAGISECKRALDNNEDDLAAAVSWLKRNGIHRAAAKLDRNAKQGIVCVKFNQERTEAVVLKVNTETDFVIKNQLFQNFVDDLATLSLKHDNISGLMRDQFEAGISVQDQLSGNIAVIGENIVVKGLEKIHTSGDNSFLGHYIHNPVNKNNMGAICCVCCLKIMGSFEYSEEFRDKITALGKNISVHIVSSSIYSSNQENEMQNTLDILLEQDYILNEKYKVRNFLNNEAGKIGVEKIEIDNFVLMHSNN